MKTGKTKLSALMLARPIERQDKTIKILMIRQVKIEDLRGLMLIDALTLEGETVEVIACRVISPIISREEFNSLDCEDVTFIKTFIGASFVRQLS